MKYQEFKEKTKQAFLNVLPDSTISFDLGALGGDTFFVSLNLAKDKSEVANGIMQNDILHVQFHILSKERKYDSLERLTDESELPEELVMEILQNYITTAPEVDYMAYGSERLPFRKTTGNAEKIVATLTKYFGVVRDTLERLYNEDELHQNHKSLVAKKLGLQEKENDVDIDEEVTESKKLNEHKDGDSITEYTITFEDEDDFITEDKDEADEKFEELKENGELINVIQYYAKTWIYDEETDDWYEDNVDVYYNGEDYDVVMNEFNNIVEESNCIKESEESSGTMTIKDLSTGVLPIVDVDMYSISEELNEFDATIEELDEIVVELAPKYIEETLNDFMKNVSLTDIKVYHPRQYNFSGDELEFTLSLDRATYEDYKNKALNMAEFKQFLKDNYKSTPGFISTMAEDLDEFNSQPEWKQVVQVLMFFVSQDDIDSNNEKYMEEFIDKVASSFARVSDKEELEESKELSKKQEANKTNDKQKFIDYCKDKVKDLGSVTNMSEEDIEDNRLEDSLEICLIEPEFRDEKDVRVLVDEEGSDIYVSQDGEVLLTGGGMSDIHSQVAQFTFSAISKKFYNDILENWEDYGYDEMLERDDVYSSSVEKIKKELKLPKPLEYNIIERNGGADVEIYTPNRSGIMASTTTMKNGKYVQEWFDIDKLWEVVTLKDNGEFDKYEYVEGWQNAVKLIQQQLGKIKKENKKVTESVEYISQKEFDELPDDFKSTVGDTIKYSKARGEDEEATRQLYKNLGYDESDPMILARDDVKGTILKPVKIKKESEEIETLSDGRNYKNGKFYLDGTEVEYDGNEIENLWTAACCGDNKYLTNYYKNGGEPNKRYYKFGKDHSLIMGAFRNNLKDTVELLKANGETILDDEQEEFNKVEEAKSKTLKFEVESVNPNYTGGGVYVYTGKLKDGNYFMASDSYFDGDFFDVTIVTANPDETEEECWYDEWQQEHKVNGIVETNEEAKQITKQILNWIITNTPKGNYDIGDMKEMLNSMKDLKEAKSIDVTSELFADEAKRRIYLRLQNLDIYLEELQQAKVDKDENMITACKSKILENIGYLIPALNIKGGVDGLIEYIKNANFDFENKFNETIGEFEELAKEYKKEYESVSLREEKDLANQGIKSYHIEDLGGHTMAVFGEFENGTFFAGNEYGLRIYDIDVYPFYSGEIEDDEIDWEMLEIEHSVGIIEPDTEEFKDIMRKTDFTDVDDEEELEESKKITESADLDFTDEINDSLNKALVEIYKNNGVSSGDITPEQSLEWDETVEKLNKLFAKIIKQNKEELDESAKNSLPENCYTIVEGKIAVITNGKKGYKLSNIVTESKTQEEIEKIVENQNRSLGVTKEQRLIMEAKSLLGWNK